MTPPTEYVLKVNGLIDGIASESLEGFGTFDVYVDGEAVAIGVSSFERTYPNDIQYEIRNIQVAPGKRYDGVYSGTLSGNAPYGYATVTLAVSTVLNIGDEWTEVNEIPAGLDLTDCDVEYKNHYTISSRTSPGDEWRLFQEGAVQYEPNGEPYESETPLTTSAERKLLGHFYFHYCNHGSTVTYQSNRSDLPYRHEITMEAVQSSCTVQYYTMDGSRKAYHLVHNSGPYAGGYASCGTNGSNIYYEGDVYQNYKPYQINVYEKVSDWTDEIDSEAAFVTYRIRLKKEYTLTFDNNGGIYEIQTLTAHKGNRIDLPDITPYRMGYRFSHWSLMPDGSGTGWTPGGYIVSDEDITLIAQWRELSALILPNNLTEIDEEAFFGTNAEYIIIPVGCKNIGDYAFRNCSNLKQIWIPADCTIGLNAFEGCDNLLIFGTSGSPANDYCDAHTNCTFVGE